MSHFCLIFVPSSSGTCASPSWRPCINALIRNHVNPRESKGTSTDSIWSETKSYWQIFTNFHHIQTQKWCDANASLAKITKIWRFERRQVSRLLLLSSALHLDGAWHTACYSATVMTSSSSSFIAFSNLKYTKKQHALHRLIRYNIYNYIYNIIIYIYNYIYIGQHDNMYFSLSSKRIKVLPCVILCSCHVLPLKSLSSCALPHHPCRLFAALFDAVRYWPRRLGGTAKSALAWPSTTVGGVGAYSHGYAIYMVSFLNPGCSAQNSLGVSWFRVSLDFIWVWFGVYLGLVEGSIRVRGVI